MSSKWSMTIGCAGLAAAMFGTPLPAQEEAEPAAMHQGRLKTPPGTAEDEVAAAVSTDAFTYQGFIENASGAIDNQTMVLEMRAWNALENGSPLAAAVTKNLAASALRRGNFAVEFSALELGLPDSADDTYLELRACSPAPCSPVLLSPRQHLTSAPKAGTSRAVGGAAYADDLGAFNVAGDGVDAGILRASRDIGAGLVQELRLDAAASAISTSRTDGNASALSLRSTTASASRTEAVIDDALSEMRLNKVNLAATAAVTTDTLRFNAKTGEVAAVRDSGTAPLRLASKSPSGDQTLMLLDDAASQVSFSKELAVANTAGICPPPKLSFKLTSAETSIAAVAAPCGIAAMTLKATSPNGDATQICLNDALGKVTISKEVAALNTAVASSKKLVIDAANGSVAAFDGTNAAALQLKSGNDAVMSYDPAVGEAAFAAPGGIRSKRVKIVTAGASNTAGPAPSAELSVNGTTGNVELRVGVEIVDRWTPVGNAGPGLSPNRISGAPSNQVTPGVFGAVIGGGGVLGASNVVDNHFGTVGGGWGNTASAYSSTVSGGQRNTASGSNSTVGGGALSQASGTSSTVGGGDHNDSSGFGSTVGGGRENTASGQDCTVGGGRNNIASEINSTVGGGLENTASGGASTVGGGYSNTANYPASTVGGGQSNTASSSFAAVGGGVNNAASGSYSTVPGGYWNQAGGDYSFAAGRQAHVRSTALGDAATDNGTFVWADSTDATFTSTAANQFLVRASGGTSIYSDSGLTAGVTLAAGGSAWAAVSDRNLKENFAEVDTRAVLDRLAETPITTWNYKSQDDSIRHMGPMGQDFRAAFGIGEEETRITTIDADGVALAAIQGLYEIVREKDCKIEELGSEISNLECQMADLKTLVKALAAQRNGGGR